MFVCKCVLDAVKIWMEDISCVVYLFRFSIYKTFRIKCVTCIIMLKMIIRLTCKFIYIIYIEATRERKLIQDTSCTRSNVHLGYVFVVIVYFPLENSLYRNGPDLSILTTTMTQPVLGYLMKWQKTNALLLLR